MELPTVESVVQGLVKRGYLANVGNPGKVMPHLTRPIIAVNLTESTVTSQTMVAYICGPKSLGQAACEKIATQVAIFWYADGADVKWGYYSFDNKGAMHITKVYATWYSDKEANSE